MYGFLDTEYFFILFFFPLYIARILLYIFVYVRIFNSPNDHLRSDKSCSLWFRMMNPNINLDRCRVLEAFLSLQSEFSLPLLRCLTPPRLS